MSEYIMLKTDELMALINIIEMLYLMCDGDDVLIESMYEDMRTLRSLRDERKIFTNELEKNGY